MPDNWGYVAAAYTIAVVALGGYWRRLVRKERELSLLRMAGRNDGASRSRQPSDTAVPRHEPGKRPSLP
jgi:hypothetical protein